MARDYKHAGTKQHRKGDAFSGWAGLGLGLTAGLALALGVHLYHRDRTPPDEPVDATGAADTGAADAPGEAPRRRPVFDFYRMLPNYELVIPEEDIAVAPLQVQAPVEAAGVYVLQAGSFRNAEDADRLRARLALLGIESRVQTVTIDDAETWHRVRIGPLDDLDALNELRGTLAEHEVEALVIRVGD